MTAFARFKNELWCMDPAYIDKLAKHDNGLKYLLVRRDLFDKTVEAKGSKTKDSREIIRAFLTLITKTLDPKRFESAMEQNLLENMANYARLKE